MISKYITQFKDYNAELSILAGDNVIRAISVPDYNKSRLEKDNQFINQFIDALSDMIKLYDSRTGEHSTNVSFLSQEIAKALGINRNFVYDIRIAALLHDLGKLSIPEHVLNKKDKLSRDDWNSIKQHPDNSMRILQTYGFPDDVCSIVSQHQERSNKSGYNARLCGDDICVGAKIVSVADAYDAMTSERPYRNAMSKNEALQILKSDSGFDTLIVEKLAEIEGKNLKIDAENLSRKKFLTHKFSETYKRRAGSILIPSDPSLGYDALDLIFNFTDSRTSLFKAKVAAIEAVYNSIIHGNCNLTKSLEWSEENIRDSDYNQSVRIDYDISPDKVWLKTSDNGPGFDFNNVPDPTIEENCDKDSGRGIFLMRKFMDKVVFNEKGNEVVLEKSLN